jgi:Tol biopolymer transport system component
VIGAELLHFRITAKLGEGGMGEVYRADDTRLGRQVAIKVLPAAFVADPERLARFEREARVLATLDHPNIAGIYEVGSAPLESGTGEGGEEGGAPSEVHFLAMQLAEGETLAERIARGPIPLDEALAIAGQIADALEAAHDKGIVHRDLKPANVKIAPEGQVKVLDFGLAKAWQPEAGDPPSQSMSPTLTAGMTQAGTLLGTAAYMAPEQARGQEADQRADVWAFGAVLWEMLTGERLFAGDTVSDTLAAVLRHQPDPVLLPDATPWAVRFLLRHCLERDSRERLRHIGDARIALAESRDRLAGGEDEGHPAAAPSAWRRWLPLAAALVVLVAALALVTARSGPGPAAPPRVVRGAINPPSGAEFNFLGENAGPVVASPDGKRVAFVARRPGRRNTLWVRELDAGEARELPGTEGAYRPFWSADSRQLGFFAGGRLKRIDAVGGSLLSLATAVSGRGGSWNRDGTILFSPAYTGPVYAVSAAGGEARPVTELDPSRKEVTHRYPYFLPDGRHFLFLVRSTSSGAGQEPAIFLGELGSKERRPLLPGASDAIFASGYLLYVRETALLAQPFSLQRLALAGEPRRLADGVQFDRRYSRGVFSAAPGVLAYQEGKGFQESELVWVDRAGQRLQTLGEPALFDDIELSPAGSMVATTVLDPSTSSRDIWLVDAETGLRQRFTFSPDDDAFAAWSADGERLAWIRYHREGGSEILVRDASGAGGEEPLLDLGVDFVPDDWSPDGRVLLGHTEASVEAGGAGLSDLWSVELGGEPQLRALAQTPASEYDPVFSPDGRWVAYDSDATGLTQVYVVPFPETGSRWQVSQEGGFEAFWRADGKELYFQADDGELMAAEIEVSGQSLRVGEVRPLFVADVAAADGYRADVAADGSRFLINSSLSQQRTTPITFVLNWETELAPQGR